VAQSEHIRRPNPALNRTGRYMASTWRASARPAGHVRPHRGGGDAERLVANHRLDTERLRDVRWVKNDYFQFIPNCDDPFIFTRANGKIIRPGVMYTDGGSIPRFAWGVPGYSAWGYAPAHIVHDWLFEAKHCGYPPDDRYTFDETIDVMAEGLKAVMEAHPEYRNYFVFDTVTAAVGSSMARRIWEKGQCKAPSIRIQGLDQEPLGEHIMTIRFP
jgi:hypothetical protein